MFGAIGRLYPKADYLPQIFRRGYGAQRRGQPGVSSSAHAGKVVAGIPERVAQSVHGAVDHHDVEFVAEEFRGVTFVAKMSFFLSQRHEGTKILGFEIRVVSYESD